MVSIVYRIDKAKGYTLVLWDGVVTASEFLTHVRRLSSDADWPPPKRLHLSDLRIASLDASMDEAILQAAADLYGQHLDKIASMKVAIVADNAFWKAIEFERIISQYGASAIVFNTLPTACIWLNLDASEVESRLQQMRSQARGRPN
jgi:hypothetical protein